jgi:L-seryl-tRNA(Ser) seleniumtransferase
LAVLEATLIYYLDEERALKEIPTWRLLSQPPAVIRERAERLVELLKPSLLDKALLEIVKDESEVGGGALPLQKLPTFCVALKPFKLSVNELERRLRSCETPVIGKIRNDKYLLDMRTVLDEEVKVLAENILESFQKTM